MAHTTAWKFFPLVWLLFLGYPVTGFLEHPRPLGDGLLFWGLVLGFTAVFLRVFWGRPSARWPVVGWGCACWPTPCCGPALAAPPAPF
ncbi:hypothetical protein [Deinococcus multiflagellatus]|uniref:Uncharacterized protein n=1 Tax=Deinococcus multiflagellatus TaxID=1656887 RepID=A0ABW1ZLY8_9DEIO